ncbi:MAG TPA: 3-dehydroquinate synthase [Opitutaceae bacterium]
MPDTVEILTVALGERSYPIQFGRDLSAHLSDALAAESARKRSIAVITDEHVERAWPELFEHVCRGFPRYVVPAGESSKSLKCFGNACEFLARERIDRGGLLVAVGGGVIGDLAGFVAASFLRGIDYWQVPTTLLAMVDSAVGGKTAINLAAGKNLVGAFHQPRTVLCDMALLDTLPAREFAAGMAEVLKYGLLADAELFSRLEASPVHGPGDETLSGIVRKCCAIKAAIVGDDERETAASGGRVLLNLGHTFAHAIEAVAGYGEYLHGEAVGVGMVAAARLSERLGLVKHTVVERAGSVIAAHHLPVRLRAGLPVGLLLDAMQRDKKVMHGRLKLVVLEAIGRAATRADVPSDMIGEIWSELGAS